MVADDQRVVDRYNPFRRPHADFLQGAPFSADFYDIACLEGALEHDGEPRQNISAPYPSADTSAPTYCPGHMIISIPTATNMIEVMIDDRFSFPSS